MDYEDQFDEEFMGPIDLLSRIGDYLSCREKERRVVSDLPKDPDELEMLIVNRLINAKESTKKKPEPVEYKPKVSFQIQVTVALFFSLIAILIICWPTSHIPKVFIVEQKIMKEFDFMVPIGPTPEKIPLFDFFGVSGRFYQSWFIDRPISIERLKKEQNYVIIGIDEENFYPIKGLFQKKYNLAGINITFRLFKELLNDMINEAW